MTASGKVHEYRRYVLARAFWDKSERRQKQQYIAYLGKSCTITSERADEICKRKGVTMADLRKVKGLKIM